MPSAAAPVFTNENPAGLAFLVWLLVAAALILQAALGSGAQPSTDDLMRLAGVRDLLAGQPWFDTAQHRMNTPYGLEMHWSRLVDAPIAATVLFFRLFADAATSETWALYVWPTLPLCFVLLAAGRIGAHLAGRTGGLVALGLTATCAAAATPFAPGSIDHHNVQIALMMWFVAALVELRTARWAAPVAAGCAVASLAIGMETLPYIVAGIGVVCVAWVTDGQAIAPAMRRFGITLAAASAVILFGAVADAYRYAAVCDTFSGIHAALGLAVGAGFAAVTLPAAGASPIRRGVSVAGVAVIVLALAAALAPACLKGPYAQMDPRIVPIWLANITEAKTPFYFAERAPAFFVVGYLYAGLASAASIAAVFVVPRGRRRAALVAAAFSLAAFLVTSWQVRGLPFALLFAMPGLAALIVGGIACLRLSARAAMAACVIVAVAASDIGLPALAGGLAGRPPAARAFAGELSAMRRECFSSAAMSELRALRNGRVLAFANEGPAILAHTGHSAVAGPYHRNAAGILDTYAAFTSPPDAARRIVQARGIDYVAVCLRGFDATRLRAAGGPGSLVALLLDGRPVAWLVPLPGARTVKIWRVVR